MDGAETAEVQDRLVYCYPVRLSIPSPPQPRVELHFENDIACLRYKGEMVKVNRGHFNKLVGLTIYRIQNPLSKLVYASQMWLLKYDDTPKTHETNELRASFI